MPEKVFMPDAAPVSTDDAMGIFDISDDDVTEQPQEEGQTVTVTVGEDGEGKRIDAFASEKSPISRSFAAELCEKGGITVNGKKVKKNFRLSAGDNVLIEIPSAEPVDVLPEDIPLDIVYEDDDLLVVDKPKGMVVHPAPGNYGGTLVNALLFHCRDSLSGINGRLRPGIVHRIDKDTKGLLIVAKNDFAHNGLASQIKEHSFSRKYHAVLYGIPKETEGRIESGIGRSKNDRKKMASYPKGFPNTKEAVTEYKVLESGNGLSYVEFTLYTGRTHQIRVHSSLIGHPVVGDPLYAGGRDMMNISGQALTAYHIGFVHPRSGNFLTFECPDGEDIERLRKIINK